MKRKNSVFARVCMILALIFMYAPILVLIIFSFNDSKSRTVWTGFSFHWYADLFSDTRILKSLATTLEVSVIAMIVATILGTMAAIGFASMRRKQRRHGHQQYSHDQCGYRHRCLADDALRICLRRV